MRPDDDVYFRCNSVEENRWIIFVKEQKSQLIYMCVIGENAFKVYLTPRNNFPDFERFVKILPINLQDSLCTTWHRHDNIDDKKHMDIELFSAAICVLSLWRLRVLYLLSHLPLI